MRQHHVAGDNLFVDYSGKKISIVDATTGEVREAEIFVGVLGASNFTYAEATFTQSLPDWIGAHARMVRFLGGVPPVAEAHKLPQHAATTTAPNPQVERQHGASAQPLDGAPAH